MSNFKKKVLKNKPFLNAKGQYNFDSNTNLSVYPYTDDKFLNKDLYSVNKGNEINDKIENGEINGINKKAVIAKLERLNND